MAHFCETCGRDFTNMRCPRCGGPPSTEIEEHEMPEAHERGSSTPVTVSDPDATLDTMIELASRPTLASLYKRGINSGLIQPTHDYAAGQVRT